MGVEGEHSKPFIPGEAGEGESQLEQLAPSCQSSLHQSTDTQNTVAALGRGGLGHDKISKSHITTSTCFKQTQPCRSSLHPRGKRLVGVLAREAVCREETGFLADHPGAVQLQWLTEGVPEALNQEAIPSPQIWHVHSSPKNKSLVD